MSRGFGGLLRSWRTARRLSQESLAFDAEVSTRHLSYLETGRAKPSREMVLILASALELELRERNLMLGSAGFAPMYEANGLGSLAMAPVRRAVDLLLAKQEPYGAVLVDRLWNVLELNGGAARLFQCFFAQPPPDARVGSNLVRAGLHPNGLKQSLVNWAEVARFTLERLEHECAAYPLDRERAELLEEVRGYPGIEVLGRSSVLNAAAPAALVHLKTGDTEVRLFTMITTIGTPLDVTAQELSIESYFPADDATTEWFHAGRG